MVPIWAGEIVSDQLYMTHYQLFYVLLNECSSPRLCSESGVLW